MATKYDEAVNYLIDYKEYDNEYVDNFTKPYEIDSDFKESVETLQELIGNYSVLEKALERACSMVSFYEGMDYKYFVEKYVKEVKKDIKELEELENGK